MKSELDLTFTIKGNTWETKLDGRVYQSGTFKLTDLDASPKQIEWVIAFSVPAGDQDKTMHGIFMLDGDSLICVQSDAAVYPRPQVFRIQPILPGTPLAVVGQFLEMPPQVHNLFHPLAAEGVIPR